jgi:Cellulase (glycosyl hydrolase family 5)
MNWLWLFLLLLTASSCQTSHSSAPLPRIAIASNGHDFVNTASGHPFHPWGMNYGNNGRLMEDFWDSDWETFAKDFRDMKAMGANVVRVHLQFGKFMRSSTEPNTNAFAQFNRLLQLAEQTGLYLDITGLACYRPADVPAWYDAMDESARWSAQARFWELVARTCASRPVVFCYDLINEPFSPGERRDPGKWYPDVLFGGYDFLQFIALDPAGRKREDIPAQWIQRMTKAIRTYDKSTLITVGMLPWSRDWHHLSGFIPEKVAPELDFLCIHLYPDTKKPGEALESLQKFAVGKPIVIEETFPLYCSTEELKTFLRASKQDACGWIGHYDGKTFDELNALKATGQITTSQSVYRQWLELFTSLKPEFVPTPRE